MKGFLFFFGDPFAAKRKSEERGNLEAKKGIAVKASIMSEQASFCIFAKLHTNDDSFQDIIILFPIVFMYVG